MKTLLSSSRIRQKRLNPHRAGLLFIGFIAVFILLAPVYSKDDIPPPINWIVHLKPGAVLPFNPKNTQWFLSNNQLSAASINDGGTITLWTFTDDTWTETGTFGQPGVNFTTFQVIRSDTDNNPGIIAGTSDPGYIDLFEYKEGNWDLQNSEKYVWSSVNALCTGKFDDTGTNYILVQNKEGYLFLFAKSGALLDLVWKSPSVWRFFESTIIRDIDGDHRDELVVNYQNGGVAVLKMVNKTITSIWENYLWGKIVAFTAGDWDNDGIPEIIFSTTQKIIYFLGYGGSGYQFEAQVSQFGFTPEQLAFLPLSGRKELLAADTSGKFHILDCDPKTKKWQENAACSTGRIAQIIVNPATQEINLWGYNQTGSSLELINPRELKFRSQSQDYPQDPAPIYLNGQYFLSPRALSKINDLAVIFQTTKTTIKIASGTNQIEVSLKTPTVIKINGIPYTKSKPSLLSKNEIYFTVDFYRQVFNLDIVVNLSQRCIEIQKNSP